MNVQKRGSRGMEAVSFDKITQRIKCMCYNLDPLVNPIEVAKRTISNIYDGISTEELDRISANIAESFKLTHPDYSILASRILVSNLHKSTHSKFSECMKVIGDNLDIKSERHYKFISDNADALDAMIVHENDYMFDFFGYKTLELSYLTKMQTPALGSNGEPLLVDDKDKLVKNITPKVVRNRVVYVDPTGKIVPRVSVRMTNKVIDRPQYVYMRVAIAIYINYGKNVTETLNYIKTCYDELSQMYYTHATPTLFNSCTKNQQLNSCFLLGTNDSIEEIMKTLSDASFISKWSGGIGIHMSNIRSHGQLIKGTNGKSSGIIRPIKMFNDAACAWDQGGKRKGAFAIYLEPWHGDIMSFLELKLQQGDECERARDLFYAIWMPDLFMSRADKNLDWSLFSEDTAPGLSSVYDGMEVCTKCRFCHNTAYSQFIEPVTTDCDDHEFEPVNAFTKLYTRYEEEGRSVGVVSAREVENAIIKLQAEAGVPYICFKDHVNRKTNQKNLGTIKSSNLCAEIMEVSSESSYACCTLASLNLKKFLVEDGLRPDGSKKYRVDHVKLHSIVRNCVRNLDLIIDANKYPVNECEENSSDYRPIGLGIQGLADLFAIKRIEFLSDEARRDDIEIIETIYHAALTESCERAKMFGSYKGFNGSPASRGILQYKMWMQDMKSRNTKFADFDPRSGRYDWEKLEKEISTDGLRNSLLVALMPTVSTSQILGNNESFEPYAHNIYTKTTLGGKFTVTNTVMIRHLIELGLWNEDIQQRVMADDGSLQNIHEIPQEIRNIYKTVWELKQQPLMERAALRGAFVDQSQSLNIHLSKNKKKFFRSVLKQGHKLGLKTGNYYIRTRASGKALRNDIAVSKHAETKKVEVKKEEDDEPMVCYGRSDCEACSA
jgi:ribonucleoside-diphosphate reductase alpha chain